MPDCLAMKIFLYKFNYLLQILLKKCIQFIKWNTMCAAVQINGMMTFYDIHQHISCKLQHISDSDHAGVSHTPQHIGRIFQHTVCIFLSLSHCPDSSTGRQHNILQRIPYPFGYILPSFSHLLLSCMKKHNNYTHLHRRGKNRYMIYNPEMLS